MTLVIMAAGMGSRFGGLKQIEPVGSNGEFIIDYSIYDAIKAGFDKVVFIIKKENYEIFKKTIGSRVEPHIHVDYVFQGNDVLNQEIRKQRVKPLGTAHAILCCKDIVKDKFAVINADDFYGYEAFEAVSKFLKEETPQNLYSVVGYNVTNTLTENGSVKRGICEVQNAMLTRIIESNIERKEGVLIASPLDLNESFEVDTNTTVSMNMFGFDPSLFKYLQEGMDYFINNNDLLKDEYLLPDLICKRIIDKSIEVKVLNTDAKWYGVTYKEDKQSLVNAIEQMVLSGKYPSNLWD